MPDFELKNLLQALGPTASLIFAAWIFLTFLQSRYTSAYEHYRALLGELRTHREQDRRKESLQNQILAYKRRCDQMRLATDVGVTSAIALICALVFGALGTIFSTMTVWKYLTALCAIAGLLLVIWAAALVLLENRGLQRLADQDLSDIPDLAERSRAGRSHQWSRSSLRAR